MAQGVPADVLFVGGNVEPPTCAYLERVFRGLRAEGVTRFVEPCAGAFAMSLLATEAGFPRDQIETSDVQLFSTAIGSLLTGRDLTDLEVAVDGVPLDLRELAPAQQVSRILYWQLRLRAELKTNTYWEGLATDLATRQPAHEADIATQVDKIASRLTGITYTPRDAWDHLKAVMDDPATVVSINPPNYTGGFERFYDTGGRLTWREPEYAMWDGAAGVRNLMAWAADKPGVLLCWEQTKPGTASGSAVYAYHNRPGAHIYILTNQPARILHLAGGLKVVPFRAQPLEKLPQPILHPRYEITATTRVTVAGIPPKAAEYYRSLWMHKLDFKPIAAGVYGGVFLDDHIAGLFGYDYGTIYRPYPGADDDVKGSLLLTFAVGAPHAKRLTRLVTMLALARQTVEALVKADLNAIIDRIITVELTKHPEIKGLRGLMTLQDRYKDPKYGYRLVYGTAPTALTTDTACGVWRAKEDVWERERAKQAKLTKEPTRG